MSLCDFVVGPLILSAVEYQKRVVESSPVHLPPYVPVDILILSLSQYWMTTFVRRGPRGLTKSNS